MKYVVLATAVALIVLNAVLYNAWVDEESDEDEWDDDDDDTYVRIDSITVQVPKVRAGDIYQYDFDFFGEIYDLNRTSGNWSRTTLDANGQLLEQVSGSSSQRDGYSLPHDVWHLHTEISLSVTITVVEYAPGEENEPLIVQGRISGSRDRYATLKGDIPIVNYAGGILGVDEIKGLDLPVNDFEFNVDNWAYPDPTIDPEKSLEERLYGQQASLSEGMNGTYAQPVADWNYSQMYNWSVDRSEQVRGYDCVRLNITLDFFGFLSLSKLLHLSNDVPRPVGINYYSGTFWNEINSTGHIILETNQVLQRDGYTQGSTIVPINFNDREPFASRHPLADMQEWDMAPADGSLSTSSFEMGLAEALDLALDESSGLNDWLRTHPSPMVTEASYAAEEIDQRTMEYTWNITLADEPGDWDDWEIWYETNGYSVNVTRRVERRIVGGDDVTTFLANEYGPHWGASAVDEKDLADKLVTLGSSEAIWSGVSRVASNVYTGTNNEVDFTDAWYALIMGGVNPGGFGIDLLDTLTGITVPTSNLTWTMQIGNVWEGADTYMVGVDAETGRMIFITDVEGPQSLSLILGNL